MTSSTLKNFQNMLETEISNLKGFGDLDQHDFTLLSFFRNDELELDISVDIWPKISHICTNYKCTYEIFTKKFGRPSKFGNSVLVIPELNPNLGAELVAFFIQKTINAIEGSYPEIMCCPLRILNSFRRFQMRNYFRNQKHANVTQENAQLSKKTKKIKKPDTNTKRRKSVFRLHTDDDDNNDTLEDDDSVIVTVSIARPLEMKTEQLKYVPTKQVLKRRKIGLAPKYGTRAYKIWYSKKFPVLKSDVNVVDNYKL